MVELLSSICTGIVTLTLQGNKSIIMDGWNGFVGMLLPFSLSKLRDLELSGIFCSDFVAKIGNALQHNTSLRTLKLFDFNNEDNDNILTVHL